MCQKIRAYIFQKGIMYITTLSLGLEKLVSTAVTMSPALICIYYMALNLLGTVSYIIYMFPLGIAGYVTKLSTFQHNFSSKIG